jgi:O-acetyl-ADP-ribose deacetylase (regulator of RNase III)
MATKIQTKVGNLMHVTEGHIVHGCNAQGVMGSGVALAVKNTWPHVFEDYEQIHKSQGLKLGSSYPVPAGPNLVVWNAITQNLYGAGQRMVSYDAVVECFEEINYAVADLSKTVTAQIHIPMIGAARGGGNWEIIREIIEQTVDCPVTLWLPDSTVTTR